MGVYGSLCMSMGIYGCLWEFMDKYNYVSAYGSLWGLCEYMGV